MKKTDFSAGGLRLPEGETLTGVKVRLRRKRLSDARNDYAWHADPELARLDAAPPLRIAYPFYLLDYTDQMQDPGLNRFPFAVETLEGRHIGNCTCYDVDFALAETQLGIMLGDREYWGRGYGADAVTTLVDHVFRHTGLRRIYLKTLDWNRRAQRCFGKCGFTPCGRLGRNGDDFILMEIRHEQWEKRGETGDA